MARNRRKPETQLVRLLTRLKSMPALILLVLISALLVWKEGRQPSAPQAPEAPVTAGQPVAGGSAMAQSWPQYAGQARAIDRSQLSVHDGDTFRVGELRVRILGIDTPEVANPGFGSAEGQPLGEEARELTERLLREARVAEYLPYRSDRYGRLLAHVFVDGELLAVRLIEDGLAYESISRYGDNGFPEIGRAIQRAARAAGPPRFEDPHQWRQRQREQQPATR